MRNPPIYFALKNYIAKKRACFHMPGHHRGKGAHPFLVDLLGEKALLSDITEVEGMDYLHKAEGVIKYAQELAANLFKVDYTFFLINGSTVGNLVMLASTLSPGDKVIIQRNSHRSIIGGLAVLDLVPEYIQPEIHPYLEIPWGITPEKLEEKLKKGNSKVVFLTSPNYFGMCEDLPSLVKVGKRYNSILLLDEAHGAHFPFNPNLPETGINLGFDMIVQSAHKTLPSLTQTSFLHVFEKNIDMDRVHDSLTFFQSSSPSYLFMASLDIVRYQMETEGERIWNDVIDKANYLREEINKIDGLYSFGVEILEDGIFDLDSTKVTVNTKGIGLTGFEVEEILNKKYNIEIELSDSSNILLFMTPGVTDNEIQRLLGALKDISKMRRKKKEMRLKSPDIPEMALTPKEAFLRPKELIPIKESEGRVAGNIVSSYPPGLPILVPGEEITKDIIEYILRLEEEGAVIQGLYDKIFIKVVK
ncbi:MAG: aminotransferase class V-fold PLP-dependent enzyme [Caldisericia bacterium]|nr:aminotransferase class V-fold PLP-dependent enzyme [Caldisericia bacterium]